jgi:membrane-associated protease RseP (regulator of RpoE activity)
VRVSSDPLEDIGVNARKAVLWTVCAVLLLVGYTIAFPTTAALIAMLLAFFVMIMLHEGGHYLAAKRSDMKVTEFFVGFGPRLWSFKRGETEYGVKPFVLGGYCRIVGMTNLEEIPPEEEERTYRAKSWHSRVFVAGAGPAVHFIIAFVLMFCVLYFGGDWRHQQATTTLAATTQGAHQAGLEPGDQVVAIQGKAITDWASVRSAIVGPQNAPNPAGTELRFLVKRGDQYVTKTVTLEKSNTDPKAVVAGVAPHIYLPHPGLLASVAQAPREVIYTAGTAVTGLAHMFSPSGIANYVHVLTGHATQKQEQNRFVSPVGFTKLAGDAVKSGWENAFLLLIAINVFVGLFNLLPLLPFDGGHIAIASYEKVVSTIRRKRVQVDVAKLMPITVAVVAVLGFILISSLYLDIASPLRNPY